MKYSFLTSILVILFISFGIDCYGQGKVKISEPDEYINGHGYVDLGLPSGLKWATCNIGATTPEGYGDYFAWGEIFTKSSFRTDNSLTRDKSVAELKSEGIIDSNGVLTRSHDAASSKWGSSWRIPTKQEFDELVNKCKWEWTILGGKKGYKVIGPNGKSIFLPAAGRRDGSSLYSAGEDGPCWSSTVYEGPYGAYYLDFYESYPETAWGGRNSGYSVRPVSEVSAGEPEVHSPKPSPKVTASEADKHFAEPTPQIDEQTGVINGYEYVDLGLPSGLKWATCNIGADSPEDYGEYFAWGEIFTKSSFRTDNSLTRGKSVAELKSEGIIDSNGELTKSHDAASSKWGSSWRMPTKKESDELVSKCKWEWTTLGGEKVCKVTGPNGKSIFLPAAGYCYGSSDYYAGDSGYYWSSTVNDDTDNACCFGFAMNIDSGMCGSYTDWIYRNDGFPVRPVSE